MDQATSLDHLEEPIEYPSSDGKPLADTDLHRQELLEIIQTLQDRFKNEDQVYVSGDLMIYFEEGDAQKCRAPDVIVVQGVEKRQRRTYKLWKEKKAPTLAMEILSKGTRNQDKKDKKPDYAQIGVDYYVLYDPEGTYLQPALQVYRRTGNDYVPMVVSSGIFPCPPLGISLSLGDDGLLVLTDLNTGEIIPRLPDALKAAQEQVRALQEEIRRLKDR